MSQFNALTSSFNDDMTSFESSQSIETFEVKDRALKQCRIYHNHQRIVFLKWWNNITFAVKEATTNTKRKRNVHWDSKKNATIWDHFHENAIVENDQSQVICKRCNDVLNHLSLDHETRIMRTHLKIQRCRKSSHIANLTQISLQERFFKKIWLNELVWRIDKKIDTIRLISLDL